MLEKRLKYYLVGTMICSGLKFVLILCIPMVNLVGTQTERMVAYLLAIAFWISFIAECCLILGTTRQRKALERSGFQSRAVEEARVGILSFFKNQEAAIIDIILIIDVILVIVLACTNSQIEWLIIICVSVLGLSFDMHCILNGKNYRYLKKYRKYKMKKEQKQNERKKS